jgi:tRNA(Ile)-lysidine synthase
MRLSRGSGVDGLAGMPLVSFSDSVRIIRPLLSLSKERLEATLLDRSVGWIEDPSNTDGRFSRVTMRRQLGRLERTGLSIASVAGAARIFGQLRAVAENDLRNLADQCVVVHPTGFADIQTAELQDAPEELKANLISVMLTLIGGRNYGPRRLRLGRLMDRLNMGGDWTGTLAGCVISLRKGVVRIIREHKAVNQALPVKPGLAVWDNRFILTIRSSVDDDLEIRALGERGWQAVSTWPRETDKFGLVANVPGPVRFGLPAIWRGQNIVEAPHFGLLDPQLSENIVKSVGLRCRAPLTAPPFWVA